MNIALWIFQGLLAFGMFGAGAFKLFSSYEKYTAKMKWALAWPPGRVKLLGFAEIVGAIGLIVPWVTGIAPILTPVAAVCLLVLMLGAIKTHADLKETVIPPAVFALFAIIVSVGRFFDLAQ